jgi:hypothetical protein
MSSLADYDPASIPERIVAKVQYGGEEVLLTPTVNKGSDPIHSGDGVAGSLESDESGRRDDGRPAEVTRRCYGEICRQYAPA